VIAEAIDTVWTLGWALLVWIVLTAAVVTLAGWTVVVAAVWACRALWRGVTGALALSQCPVVPELPRVAPGVSDARTAASAPTWAQPDKDAA
jgi:Na+/melibiose symporter-like transporter